MPVMSMRVNCTEQLDNREIHLVQFVIADLRAKHVVKRSQPYRFYSTCDIDRFESQQFYRYGSALYISRPNFTKRWNLCRAPHHEYSTTDADHGRVGTGKHTEESPGNSSRKGWPQLEVSRKQPKPGLNRRLHSLSCQRSLIDTYIYE